MSGSQRSCDLSQKLESLAFPHFDLPPVLNQDRNVYAWLRNVQLYTVVTIFTMSTSKIVHQAHNIHNIKNIYLWLYIFLPSLGLVP